MEKFFTFLAIGICIQMFATIRISASSRTSNYRGTFGESCNKTMRCKSQSWLVCNPVTFQCACAKPDEMVYDKDTEKCVAMIGERCKYGFGSDVENVALFYEKVDCVGGAVCRSEDAICACPIGTYEENICVPVKPRGANCQLSTECDQTASLICLDGKCECPNDDMLFDDIHGSCRTKAGKNCVLSNQKFGEGPSRSFACVNGSECMLSSATCTCVSGMYMSSGNCIPLKGLESHCSSSEECDSSQMLICINRRCECDPTKATKILSSHTVQYTGGDYDYSRYYYIVPAGICVGKVGTSCSVIEFKSDGHRSSDGNYTAPAVNGLHCIRNGFCTKKWICTCANGYSKTSDGLCGIGYNQHCSEERICSDEFTCTRTDEHDIRCRCPNMELQVYEDDKCKGVVGGPCKQEIGCVKNARCVESMEPLHKGSVCECQDGFIEFDEYSCDVRYGFKCNSTLGRAYCDRKSRLICTKKSADSEFRCSCPNAYDVFESRLRKCSRVVGFRCKEDYDCVTNAYCFTNPEALSGRCTCKSGFQFSYENRNCFPIGFSYETITNVEEENLDTENKTNSSP